MTRQGKAGCVYLIGPLEGCHKIGESINSGRRLSQLLMPIELKVIAEIYSDNRGWLERYLHMAFAHRHARGEWFRLSPRDLALLRKTVSANAAVDLPVTIVQSHDRNAKRYAKTPGGRGRPKGSCFLPPGTRIWAKRLTPAEIKAAKALVSKIRSESAR